MTAISSTYWLPIQLTDYKFGYRLHYWIQYQLIDYKFQSIPTPADYQNEYQLMHYQFHDSYIDKRTEYWLIDYMSSKSVETSRPSPENNSTGLKSPASNETSTVTMES